ncbi:MAG: CHAD domain-containing protein [Rhodobacteraceae bacterium]|nr:CHAD domain-containing protein [Paracoccaceae bacterium]
MNFSFELADKTAEDALRRIAPSLLSDAITLAKAAPESGQLHAIRKNIKMTRGLLRLVAPRFTTFKRENRALRDAARLIAKHRDAEVMAQIVVNLAAEGADNGEVGLDGTLSAADTAALRTNLDALAADLAAIAARANHWHLEAEGFDALESGLRETWSACRDNLKVLRKTHDDAALHRWRGQIKTHWYHARLLQPIWPEMMAPHIEVADALGELLGDHHDLAVLRARMAQGSAPTAAARSFDKRCAKRQALAEHEIFALADRFLAEPAKPLAARWRRWWQLWRA